MPRTKRTPTQKELANAARAKQLSSKGNGGGVPWKTKEPSKSPCTPLPAKVTHKGGGAPVLATGGIQKPKSISQE